MSDYDLAQRALLEALLEAHPRLLGIDDLGTRLRDVPRTGEALRVLVGDGLVTRLGDRVGVSRAAVRFDALRRPTP
jgi:hypothetical protein